MSLTLDQLEEFATDLAATPEQWGDLVRHATGERIYERIWDDEEVNAWLICWSADQDTGFHDHDQSAAGIVVISGEVREERLRLGSAPRSRAVRAGSSFGMAPAAIHRVLHSGDVPAVTIHAYSPPLVRTGAYRTGLDGELLREPLSIEHELRAPIADLAAR
jgi:hypothetical protein